MKPRARLAALAAACAALWALYLKGAFCGFSEDPVWYLEPARAFARGNGLVTRLLYPAQLAQFPEGVKLPVPPLHHGPLALYLLGFLYKVFGFHNWAPLGYGFGVLLLVGLVAYALGREAGGERAGLLAAALYWTQPMLFRASAEELTDPLFNLLVALGLWSLWRAQKGRTLALSALSGLLLGLASATRLAGQAYWLAFFAACWYLLRNKRALAALTAGLAAALVPLAIYNHHAAGVWFYSPGIYLLLWSKTFPGFRSSTTFMDLSTGQALLVYPQDVIRKLITGALYAPNRFLEAAQDPYLAAAIAFALFSSFGDKKLERFRRFGWLVLLPVAAVNVVISYGAVHYLLPVFPLLAALAAAWIWRQVDGAPWLHRRRWLQAVLGLWLLVSPAALTVKAQWKARPEKKAFFADLAAFGDFLKASTTPGEVIYSDKPADVVWYGDRAAVGLTATLADAGKAFARLAPDALVLTSSRVHSEDYDPAWGEAFDKDEAVLGFEPCGVFTGATFKAALYRRLGACKPQT